MTARPPCRILVSTLALAVAAPLAMAEGLDDQADRAQDYMPEAAVLSLDALVGPVADEPRPAAEDDGFAAELARGFDGIDSPDRSGAAPVPEGMVVPAQAAAPVVAPADPPPGWTGREVLGLRFAAPADMGVMEEAHNLLTLFRGDPNVPRGEMLVAGIDDEEGATIDEMIETFRSEGGTLSGTGQLVIDGAEFDWADMSMSDGGVTLVARMFVSRMPYGEHGEPVMLATVTVGTGQPFDPGLRDAFLATLRLPAPASPAGDGPVVPAQIETTEITAFMRMVHVPLPADWHHSGTHEEASLSAPDGSGRVRFLFGYPALQAIAGIPPHSDFLRAVTGDRPSRRYDLADRILVVWEDCPYAGEPLAMEISGRSGFADSAVAAVILSGLRVAMPSDAQPCGADVRLPGDDEGHGAAAPDPQPEPQADLQPDPAPVTPAAPQADPAPALWGEDTFGPDPMGYTIYTNARYGMMVSYPGTYFNAAPQPDSGDGRSFVSVDTQAEFHVFAQFDALERGIGGMLAEDRKLLVEVTAETEESGAYTLAGRREGQSVLIRVIRDGDGLTRRFEITCPIAREQEFAPVIAYMAESFRPPPQVAVAVPVPLPVPQAAPVPLPAAPPVAPSVAEPGAPPVASVNLSAIAGRWHVNLNGYGGELVVETESAGLTLSGGIGREELADLAFDGVTLTFLRPRGDQFYTGRLEGDRITGTFTQGADPRTYNWSAEITERHGPAAQPAIPPATPPLGAGRMVLGPLTTPARGTSERTALMDAARPVIVQEIGLPLIFVVSVLNSDGTWAYLQGTPVNPDGTSIDWSCSNVAHEMAMDAISDVAMVLMRRVGGTWGVVDHIFGPTDVTWLDWVSRYGIPEALFKP